MGGKKAVEKSREWEKERRDKLNTGFNDLCKLLPDHDPSISLSKMDILKKAAVYIRLLQEQNEEIIKSGNDDVLKNEAQRLKKRVAYLVLKTRDLVTALRAAGIPIPKNKIKKTKKNDTERKVANRKDQNHKPTPTVANSAPQVACAVVLTNPEKIRSGVVPGNTVKKVKSVSNKATKKNPLSELNCATTTAPGVPTIMGGVTVVACNSLPQATILSASNATSIHALNIEKNILASTLGPGTLILRDGRVVTVPPPASMIPQILVKPQPALIVMQRAQPVPLRRDKFPLIVPKRREITQTTYANKAPIPAIKAFRLESYPRTYKSKAKKKKEGKDGGTTANAPISTAATNCEKVANVSVNNDVASSSASPVNVSCGDSSPHSSGNHLKRKAEAAMNEKSKLPKLNGSQLPASGDKQDNPVSENTDISKDHSTDEKLDIPKSSELDGKMLLTIDSTSDEAVGNASGFQSQAKETLLDCNSPKINDERVKISPNGDGIIEGGKQVDDGMQEQSFQENYKAPHNSSPTEITQTQNQVVASEVEMTFISGQFALSSSSKTVDSIVESSADKRGDESSMLSHQSPTSTPAVLESVETPNDEQFKAGMTCFEMGTTEKFDLPKCANVGELEKADFDGNLVDTAKQSYVNLEEFSGPQEKSLNSGNSLDISMNIHLSPDLDSSKPVESVQTPQYGRTEHFTGPKDELNPSTISRLDDNVTNKKCSENFSSGKSNESIQHSACPPEIVKEKVHEPTAPPEKLSNGNMKTIETQGVVDPKPVLNTSIMSVSSHPERIFSFEDTVQNHLNSCEKEPKIPPLNTITSCNVVGMSSNLNADTIQAKEKSSNSFTKTLVNIGSEIGTSGDVNRREVSVSGNGAYPDDSSEKRIRDSKSNKPVSNIGEGADRMVPSCNKSSRNDVLPQGNEMFPVASQESKQCQDQRWRSVHSHAKTTAIGSIPPGTYTSSSHMYSMAMTGGVQPDPPRPESFFNYENPIATLPSTDPYFSNFMGKTSDMAPASCSATPNTSFNYSSFTTQASPVRSVARQLFPADPLCSIANSYNLLNTRQNELDPNLPPLNSSNSTQMFQFGAYSSASSYRDPLFFPNELVTTPTKPTSGGVIPSENISQNEKESTSLCHPMHNFTDLLHPSTSINTFSNKTCNFGVGNVSSSSSYIPTEFHQITSVQSAPSHKQFISAEPQSLISGPHTKQNTKSCGNDGNFSMNVITSSSSSKTDSKGQPDQPQSSRGSIYKKSGNESTQNFNFHYLHSSQGLPSQVDPEIGYNVNPREPMQPSNNLSGHHYRTTQNQMVPTSGSANGDKSVQKASSHNNLNSHKSSQAKEFNMNTAITGGPPVVNMRDNERFGVQSGGFINNACNQYPEPTLKSRRGNTSSSNVIPHFHSTGNNQLSSNNQEVQTQQSYLVNSNSQLVPQPTKNSPQIPSSGNQSFSTSTQSSNHQPHLMHSDKKYARVTSVNQDLPCAAAAPHYSMKSNTSHQLMTSDPPDCNTQNRQVQKGYQTVSSLAQTTATISSHNHINFSSSNVFTYPNVSSHQRPFQGPIFSSSYSGGSSSSTSQLIYSNPTTVAASNQVYSHNANSSSTAPGHQQNIFSLSHMSTGPSAHANQMSNRSHLVSSSNTQLFSTVDSLAQHNHDSVGQNHKSHINSSNVRNPNQHSNHSHSTTIQSNGHIFSGSSTSQSMHQASANHKSSHNDAMPNFSMSNLASYPQNTNLSHQENQQVMPKRLHSSSNQNYNQISNSKPNIPQNKMTNQYPPVAGNNALAPSKQCDYPLASILTGLNDPILNNSVISNEVAPNHHIKNTSEATSNEKNSGYNEKVVNKQYSTNSEGNAFKSDASCTVDYLRNKDNERNSFIPIIEDVRLNSEFSNDLFSSLQVPTGGAHSDSISPTAAFLLAFPLVSTSKNTENLHEPDQQDNNTSTPTTILQIGNIEPPNSELFHPLEFGKDMEPSDYLGQVQDKCKRKENVSQAKPKKQGPANVYSNTYNYPGMSSDYSAVHYDQSWSDSPNKSKPVPERKKTEKTSKQFNNNSNNFEFCKQDKKKKNKISVNWMTAPDANESFQKDGETSSFPTSSLQFPMDMDSLPDLCATKKNNNSIYSWSPSKSLLPLDSGLMIPSTLPTLVGDLALGTTTPSDPYSKRCDARKTLEKPPEKRENPQKAQNNFLSVSQLVDPKSKKQKLPETKCKKTEKKKGATFQKRKESNEPCMYPDNFLPPLGWDKYRYKNNYSAEALIGSQDMNDSLNFPYQQNANYFMGADFNQDHHPQSQQQYQNTFSFSQNQFTSFVAEEYQNDNFSVNQPQNSTTKRGTALEKRDTRCREEATSSRFLSGAGTYHHAPTLQPYPTVTLPPSSSTTTSQPQIFTSNTTTSVTNFNLSTIFPEINERTGSQGQQSNQPQQQRGNIQHPHNSSMNSFPNNTPNSYL